MKFEYGEKQLALSMEHAARPCYSLANVRLYLWITLHEIGENACSKKFSLVRHIVFCFLPLLACDKAFSHNRSDKFIVAVIKSMARSAWVYHRFSVSLRAFFCILHLPFLDLGWHFRKQAGVCPVTLTASWQESLCDQVMMSWWHHHLQHGDIITCRHCEIVTIVWMLL